MTGPRRFLVLAALGLALGVIPASRAQDPGIDKQIAKLKQALAGQKGPDVQRLRSAATSLMMKRPAALQDPAANSADHAQIMSVQIDDEPPEESAKPPELTLTDGQREILVVAYQDYAKNIYTLAQRDPFDAQAASELKDAVAVLDRYLARLNLLVPMPRTSAKYQQAVQALVNDVSRNPR